MSLPSEFEINGGFGPVTVRRARLGDADAYVHLHIELLNVTYAHLFDPGFVTARRAEFEERRRSLIHEIEDAAAAEMAGRDPFRQHWIAESRQGTLVAVASAGEGVDDWEAEVIGEAWRPPAATWCVDHLYVVPGLHGSGLAQAMLAVLLPHQRGYLWVFRDNHRAIRFYERNGFVADGLSAPSGPTWGNQLMDRMIRPG